MSSGAEQVWTEDHCFQKERERVLCVAELGRASPPERHSKRTCFSKASRARPNMAASLMRPAGPWFVTSGCSCCRTGQEESRCTQNEPERLSVSPSLRLTAQDHPTRLYRESWAGGPAFPSRLSMSHLFLLFMWTLRSGDNCSILQMGKLRRSLAE